MSRIRTVVATEILLVVGMLVFVGLAWTIERLQGLDAPIHLGPVAALALSAVPALLWLGYFYQQDHHEPEQRGDG